MNRAEYRSYEAARSAAVRGIAELIAESIIAGEMVSLSNSIIIEDASNELLETIKFGDLFIR